MLNSKNSDRLADMLKCIAHPVKLDILWLLTEHKMLNVSEIKDLLKCNCEQSLLSHHLIKMKDKGILLSEKMGKNIYYQLKNPKIKELFPVLDSLEQELIA
jgi:DNA-binding transcriptional ArsR family regulator